MPAAPAHAPAPCTLDSAFATISALAEDFVRSQDYYTSPGYPEASARSDFINKFLAALGWDVTHEWQKNPYQQEVKSERGLRIGDSHKYADYAFFVAPNFQRAHWFLEAKKPSEKLDHPDFCFQIERYTWHGSSAKIGVLFNFTELILLDARLKPDIANAQARILERYGLPDYRDPERFAKIYYRLSREAVAAGALEQWMQDLPPPRIAGAGRNARTLKVVPSLDDAFLADMDGWRAQLAAAFKKRDADLDGETLTEITQRCLDRLIFIRFLEDKGILDSEILAPLCHSADPWPSFIAACRRLDGIYNGIVFKQHALLDAPGFCEQAGALVQILTDLAGPYSPYLFHRIPIHVLGSIYERFMGKVIRTTPKGARLEEKEEVRRAGGVYYTPEAIVRYIVRHTVGTCIAGKTPQEVLQMRFADIACGSGSFLLGVFEELLRYCTDWFNTSEANRREARRLGCQSTAEGGWRLSLHQRRTLLLHCIYGVDIDTQAVEVAQLSLYLKLLEAETTASAYQYTLDHAQEKLLPSLSHNIVCGNALIERDINGVLDEDESLRKKFNPMNMADAFPAAMRAGGFDAVIGNPPYRRQESLGTIFKDYAQRRYQTFAPTADLYAYFVERAHSLLKPGGAFGYIVSNKFMRARYGRALRQFLATQSRIQQIIDFGELPVFAAAATFPAILITQRTPGLSQRFTHAALKRLNLAALDQDVQTIGQTLDETALSGENWSLISGALWALWNKVRALGTPLGEYVEGKIYRGVLTGLNEAFVIDAATRKRLVREDRKCVTLIKPFALGDDVRNYEIRNRERFLICIPNGWTAQRAGKLSGKAAWGWFAQACPAIAAYLAPFEKAARRRQDRGEYWWELRPCDYYEAFEQPKIVFPDIAKESRFALDTSGLYLANTAYVMPLADLFLLGVLNSKLVFAFFKSIATALGDVDRGGRLRWIRQDVTRIPICKTDAKDALAQQRHSQITRLVERMLQVKGYLARATLEKDQEFYERERASLDARINALVYECYGLTQEEIALIEGAGHDG